MSAWPRAGAIILQDINVGNLGKILRGRLDIPSLTSNRKSTGLPRRTQKTTSWPGRSVSSAASRWPIRSPVHAACGVC